MTLTATQRQMWALDRTTGSPAVLNLSYALAIDGPLDRAALAGAMGDLVRSNEPLRTVYLERGGEPVAEVAGPDLALSTVDLAPRRISDLGEAAQLLDKDRECGFDLSREAPIRGCLLAHGGERHVLLLTLHHIAVDGWSLRLLCQQLSAFYRARRHGETPALTPPPIECREYAERQRTWLASPVAEREVQWWLEKLRDATPHPPMWPVHRRVGGAELHRQVVVLPDALVTELRALGRGAGASKFVLLLAAFEALMACWSEGSGTVVGTLAAGRPTPESAYLLGAHYNTLLLGRNLGVDASLAECLLSTAARTMSALDRQAVPFAVLASRLESDLGWNLTGMPGAMLQLDRHPMDGLKLVGCRVSGLYLDDGGPFSPISAATTAGLTFFAREAGEHLTLSALYSEESVPGTSVSAALGAYVEILAAMCESPRMTLSELELSLEGTDAPVAGRARGSRRVLVDVTERAPAEALSPVGRWIDPFGSR